MYTCTESLGTIRECARRLGRNSGWPQSLDFVRLPSGGPASRASRLITGCSALIALPWSRRLVVFDRLRLDDKKKTRGRRAVSCPARPMQRAYPPSGKAHATRLSSRSLHAPRAKTRTATRHPKSAPPAVAQGAVHGPGTHQRRAQPHAPCAAPSGRSRRPSPANVRGEPGG